MTLRCPRCNNRITEKACTFCPDPEERLLALQSRFSRASVAPKRLPQGHWWMRKLKEKPIPPVSGQDAALPLGDR